MIPSKKFILDIFLMIMLILLMYVGLTGLLIHEYLGIAFTILVFIHLLLNYKWIKSVGKNLNKVSQKIKTIYMINIVVLITYLITIVTGILISKYIFLFLGTSTSLTTTLHYIFGYTSLVLTFLHLVLHYKEIRATIERKIDLNYSKKLSYAMLTVITMMFLVIIYDKKDLLKINNKKDEVYKEDASSSSSKTAVKSSSEPLDTPPSLYDYLSKLHCNGCGNRCLLTSLRCSKGEAYKQMAEADYNEKYNINN